MPDTDGIFTSIEEVRAHYYPHGAEVVSLARDEVLDLPGTMAEQSMEAIKRIAAAPARKTGRSRKKRTASEPRGRGSTGRKARQKKNDGDV